MKDANFLMAVEASPSFIRLSSEEVRKHILNVVKSDVDFLAGLGFMDYSLLIGIEKLADEDLENCGYSPEKVH